MSSKDSHTINVFSGCTLFITRLLGRKQGMAIDGVGIKVSMRLRLMDKVSAKAAATCSPRRSIILVRMVERTMPWERQMPVTIKRPLFHYCMIQNDETERL